MTMVILNKENHLIGVGYIFKGLIHYNRGPTWWHAGTHGIGEVPKRPRSFFAGNRK